MPTPQKPRTLVIEEGEEYCNTEALLATSSFAGNRVAGWVS
jgi:hypothetical protein